MNELEVVATVSEPMTAIQVKAQVNRIQEIMKGVMQEGQHYGKIPGAGDKPTLFKAGAEKLLMTFRLAPEVLVEPIFLHDGIGYRITVNLKTWDGHFVGSGVGEASSLEEKHNWREAICEEEFEETPVDQRRVKWSKRYGKVEKVKQVRTNAADKANTILKMAKKRALVDATLTTLAASDIFAQDIEDMDPSQFGDSSVSGNAQSRKAGKGGPISDPQQKRLFALANENNVPLVDLNRFLREKHAIESAKQISKSDYETVCQWVQAGGYKGHAQATPIVDVSVAREDDRAVAREQGTGSEGPVTPLATAEKPETHHAPIIGNPVPSPVAPVVDGPISPDEYRVLIDKFVLACKDMLDTEKPKVSAEVRAHFGVRDMKDLPKARFQEAVRFLENYRTSKS